MPFKIERYEVKPDFSVEVKPDGVRPLTAEAVMLVPSPYGYDDRITIKLSKHRLEILLDHFDGLIADELAQFTRDDDKLIGGEDVLPPPTEIEQLRSKLAAYERNSEASTMPPTA